jgi:hypothetical protein
MADSTVVVTAVIFLFALPGVLLLLLHSFRESRKEFHDTFQLAIAPLGLSSDVKGSLRRAQAVGMYRGRRLYLTTAMDDIGETDGEVTQLTLELYQATVGWLAMSRAALHVERLDRIIGSPTSKSGHKDLDEWYGFSCEPEDFAFRLFASPALRQRLLERGRPYKDSLPLWIDLRIRVSGNVAQATVPFGLDRLQALCDLLTEVAEAVELNPVSR